MTSRTRNHCSLPTRTNTRPDKYRKPPGTAYIPQIPPPPVKQEYAPADEPEYASDNDFKASGDPESDDSLSLGDANAAADANGDLDQQYRAYDDAKREKLVKSVIYAAYPKNKRTPAYVTEAYDDYAYQAATTNVQRKPQDYNTKKAPAYEPNSPAHQKLQQLRELQHRRDFTEKYYAQEIRRLIAEQSNLDAKPVSRNTAVPTLPPQTRSGYVAERPATAAAAGFDDLEACGTMTTITRLDCGCVDQITRPIFTTAAGRVQRRTCAQGQQVHMQLSTPSARLVNGHPRIRSKSFGEPRSNSAAAAVGGQEATGAASRAASPTRKLSESSVNSM